MGDLIEFGKKSNQSVDPLAGLRNMAGEDIVAGFFTEEGQFVSYTGSDLTLMQMLFVVDSFKRRIDQKIEDGEF